MHLSNIPRAGRDDGGELFVSTAVRAPIPGLLVYVSANGVYLTREQAVEMWQELGAIVSRFTPPPVLKFSLPAVA